MTEETSKKIEECTCDSKPAETPKAETKVEAPVVAAQTESTPAWATSLTTSFSGLMEKLDAITPKPVAATPKPEAQVASENTVLSLSQIEEKMRSVMETSNYFRFTLPYDQVRNFSVTQTKNPSGLVQESRRTGYDRKLQISEAYTLSGTHTAIDQIPGVQTVPGGIDYTPLRQFTNSQSPPKGKASATFYKKGLPNVVTQTVGTTATESSMTVTAVNVSPSTISGVYFKVSTLDEEDVPYGLTSEITDAISQVVVDFENNDIANTVCAQGTLTPGLWANGNTGATITHSDIASMTADPSAIGKGMAYLRNQGYTKFGKPAVMMHPTNVDQLLRDSDINSYVQFGNSQITTSGVFPELYGCSIIPTNSVEAFDNTTNDVYNAIMFIPGLTFGSAYKRDLNVEFHRIPEDNQIRVVANWRYKTGVIDASSTVRISCAQ